MKATKQRASQRHEQHESAALTPAKPGFEHIPHNQRNRIHHGQVVRQMRDCIPILHDTPSRITRRPFLCVVSCAKPSCIMQAVAAASIMHCVGGISNMKVLH